MKKERDVVMISIILVGFFLLMMDILYGLNEKDSIEASVSQLRGREADDVITSHFVSKFYMKIQQGSASANCQPLFNIMYLKTHKCASSTMQNILFRYACTHNQRHETIPCGPSSNAEGTEKDKKHQGPTLEKSRLSNWEREEDPIFVAVPHEGCYAGGPTRFKAEMLQYPKWLLPPSGLVNMFGLHTRMDPYELQKITHSDALWFTVLRHPATLYPSAFTYFKVDKAVGASLNEYLRRPLSVLKRTPRVKGMFGANQMTFDLGYDPDVFYDDDKIDDMIRDLEDIFDVVLIAERLDESLILLGHALCWSLDDLVSLRKNVRLTRQSLTTEEQSKIEELNYSDMRLCHHFSSKFEEVVQRYGKSKLEEEVAVLRAKMEKAETYCVESMVDGHDKKASVIEYSADVFGFKLSHPEDPFCRTLAWNSRHYVAHFRDLMRRRYGK